MSESAEGRDREKAEWKELLNKKAITIEQAAWWLSIGRTTAYAAAKDGSLPTVRVGRRLLVPVAALDRMLAGQS